MRRTMCCYDLFRAILLMMVVNLAPGQALRPAEPKPATLRAGPIYTMVREGKGPLTSSEPQYPNFDVVVPLEPRFAGPALDPGGWQETEPGRSDARPASKVRRFEQTGYGMSVVLVLDVSGSMRGRTMNTIRTSIAKVVNDAHPQDRIAVMTFADDVRVDVPFTAQPAQIRKAIDGLSSRGHETHLYDAMLTAVNEFNDSMPKRRVVIVMSDGHDEGSKHTLKQVIDEASSRSISINTIGITRFDARYLTSLQSASRDTGGTYSLARTDKEMDDLLSNGIAALNQTPVVTFATARSDVISQTVPIKVTWKPQQIIAAADLTTAEIRQTSAISKHRKLPTLGWASLATSFLLIIIFIQSKKKKAVVRTLSPAVSFPIQEVPPVLAEAVRVSSVPKARFAEPAVPYANSPPSPVASPVTVPPSRRQTRLAVPFAGPIELPIAFLKTLNGSAAGSLLEISKDCFTIGAAPENTLSINDDPTVSGHHARLSLESSILMLDDLESTNGTYINGVLIAGTRRSLSPGDEIRVGRTRFLIVHP